MNSLDELFAQALDREAMPTTQERRGAVAAVTVRGALRRRRARAGAQAAATLVAAVAVVGGVSLLLGRHDAAPAETPKPAPSATVRATAPATASGVLTQFDDEDPRMPLEPAMTAKDWAAVDASWDVELASMGGGSDGTTMQVYLTAPGGERLFAFGYRDFELTAPILLSYQPQTNTALVYDADTKTLYSVDLLSGEATQITNLLEEPIVNAWPLGRTSDGAGVFAMETRRDDDSIHTMVLLMDGDVAAGVYSGTMTVSPVWGDRVVTREGDAMYVVDVTGATTGREFADLEGCEFNSWTTAGTFLVFCHDAQGDGGSLVEVNPDTGEQTDLGVHVASPGDIAFDTDAGAHAIDTERAWRGQGTWGRKIFPPVVYQGVESANLQIGFSTAPDTYTVIFGARGTS